MSKTDATRQTLGYYLLFICLGLNTAIIGPTLPALAAQTHTPLGRMGWLFMAAAIGQTLGTVFGGRLFDRVRGHPALGVAQMASAASLALIPLLPSFWVLLTAFVVRGIADGVVHTGGNVLLIWTRRERVAPYMNGLHFCCGIGAFLSPILVAQTLALRAGHGWAYGIVAAFAASVGLRLLTLPGNPRPAHHRESDTDGPAGTPVYYSLVLCATLYLFFYVGAELAFGGWLYTYATMLHLAGAVGAAYLTSGFWLSFTLGRLISIPVAIRLAPPQIIRTALCACLSLLVLEMALPGSRIVLWAVAWGLGLCLGPLWPAGFTLAGQSLWLTARLSGIILLGDSCGAMVLPWLVGQILGAAGPRAMIYLVFGSLVCNLFAFVALMRLRHNGVSAPLTRSA